MSAKDTKGKPKLSYIPWKAMKAIAEVRQFGVDKYGDDTCWKQVDKRDFLDAALRHIYKHLDGTEIDPESGLEHIAHAATSLILALGLAKEDPAFGLLKKKDKWCGAATFVDLQSCYDEVVKDYEGGKYD